MQHFLLCSHKCGFLYTRFHAFMLSPTLAFKWWRKTGKPRIFVIFFLEKERSEAKQITSERQGRAEPVSGQSERASGSVLSDA